MKFAILGLLVVLLIGFFIVVWKAAQNWRWYHIVSVCVTMLLGVVFLFPTANVLKSRSEWHKLKENLEKQAAELQTQYRLIKYGDPANPDAGDGVVILDQKLAKLAVEAGRRWRNLRLQGSTEKSVTLVKAQTAADEAIPGAPVDDTGSAQPEEVEPLVPESLVVYGFAETPSPADQTVLVPTFYLGEFRVTSSTPSRVVLTPTGPLEQNQMRAIGSGQASSWSLYELLPLDGHEPFVAPGSVPSDDNYLGRVDDEAVKSLLGNRVSEETLQEYLRDGSRARQDDPPLSRWTKIEFEQDYKIVVDSPEQRGALDGGFFDGNGRAVDGRLQRGDDGSVTFQRGDQILLKEEAANDLINQGVARLIDRYFLRPLNDYRFVLRRIRLRLSDLAARTTELNFEQQVLRDAIEKTEGMIVVNQGIKLKLEQDLAQFRVEKNAIEQYTGKLQQQTKDMKQEMLRLHRENLALEQQIDAIHSAIERRESAFTLNQ